MSDTQAPYIKPTVRKSSGRFKRYGLWWQPTVDPASMELDMIRHGGRWIKQDGDEAGEGLEHHYRKFQETVWPGRLWQKGPYINHWAYKCLEVWLNYKYIGVMGCASSGKSDSFGSLALTDWYAFPDCTTVLVSSTDMKSLERRVWGMIKGYHRAAKKERSWIPGHLIEGRQMIIQDSKQEFAEGRDFKNGISAIPCYKGNQFVGLGSWIGIHNKRVRVIADEGQLMARAYLDATANLSKCEDFKIVVPGNPNETTNAHGSICEPHMDIGGWEGGIDQTPMTKMWQTRFPNGICLQLPGNDSPNMKAPEGEPPPFPFLMTRQQIKDDGEIWGIDDWHHSMFCDAKMPRGQGTRRVLTRQACLKFGAFEPPKWRDSRRTSIAFLDAAYRGVGGDRCVFGELQFGAESVPIKEGDMSTFINQDMSSDSFPKIIALIDLMVIPIQAGVEADQPEDQIVKFCQSQCEARGIAPENLFYDAGMRTSLVTSFCRLWSTATNSVDCGGPPSETQVSSEIRKTSKEYYSKFVTELWFSVRYAVESRQFRGLTEEACNEFCQREWKLASGNRIEIESKEDMKIKTGRSPDLADAIAVGLFGARRKGFVISRLLPQDDGKPRGRDWRDEAREKAKLFAASGQLNYAA